MKNSNSFLKSIISDCEYILSSQPDTAAEIAAAVDDKRYACETAWILKNGEEPIHAYFRGYSVLLTTLDFINGRLGGSLVYTSEKISPDTDIKWALVPFICSIRDGIRLYSSVLLQLDGTRSAGHLDYRRNRDVFAGFKQVWEIESGTLQDFCERFELEPKQILSTFTQIDDRKADLARHRREERQAAIREKQRKDAQFLMDLPEMEMNEAFLNDHPAGLPAFMYGTGRMSRRMVCLFGKEPQSAEWFAPIKKTDVAGIWMLEDENGVHGVLSKRKPDGNSLFEVKVAYVEKHPEGIVFRVFQHCFNLISDDQWESCRLNFADSTEVGRFLFAENHFIGIEKVSQYSIVSEWRLFNPSAGTQFRDKPYLLRKPWFEAYKEVSIGHTEAELEQLFKGSVFENTQAAYALQHLNCDFSRFGYLQQVQKTPQIDVLVQEKLWSFLSGYQRFASVQDVSRLHEEADAEDVLGLFSMDFGELLSIQIPEEAYRYWLLSDDPCDIFG